MRFLVGSSVWLELLLAQRAAPEVEAFLRAVPAVELAISQFALHSIGVILTRRGDGPAYARFLRDIVMAGPVAVLSLSAAELANLPAACARLGLDFDDGYQYVVAEQAGLTLISFDAHFDRTPRERRTPAAAMGMIS